MLVVFYDNLYTNMKDFYKTNYGQTATPIQPLKKNN